MIEKIASLLIKGEYKFSVITVSYLQIMEKDNDVHFYDIIVQSKDPVGASVIG